MLVVMVIVCAVFSGAADARRVPDGVTAHRDVEVLSENTRSCR
jgi:hypothetical protein